MNAIALSLNAPLAPLVATTPVWPGSRRVRLLTAEQPARVRRVVVGVATNDPRLSVLFGLHLTQRVGWTSRAEVAEIRSRLARGGHADHYRLGRSFRGGMRDAALEWDLVELLATMPNPAVAASLAEEMPPLTTDSAAAVAIRLADLDNLVAAVITPAASGDAPR